MREGKPLVVQWLGLRAFTAREVRSWSENLRSSKPCSIAKKGKKKNKNLPKKKSPGPGGFTDELNKN